MIQAENTPAAAIQPASAVICQGTNHAAIAAATHPASPERSTRGSAERRTIAPRSGVAVVTCSHHRSPLSPVPGTVSNVSLQAFSPAVREWFAASFDEPTRAQRLGWKAVAGGDHTLILAPTGSGKTLAAFLWAIDRLSAEPPTDPLARTRVLYISPLRALAVDVEKNLRAPLAGIQHAAERLGAALPHVPVVGVRTGDTPANERRDADRHPPDILITTPESLYLMLTSSARETLRSVRWVIVDEIHALAATKRGAHLALSLERLEALSDAPPQRIGLSATQRPLEEIARFLGGHADDGAPRPVTIVDAGHRKPMELEVVVPVEDMAQLGAVPPSPQTPAGAAANGVHLALHPSAPAGADPGPPLHHRVRERPPPGRAAGLAAERAGRGGPRARAPRGAGARAADRGRGRAEVGDA